MKFKGLDFVITANLVLKKVCMMILSVFWQLEYCHLSTAVVGLVSTGGLALEMWIEGCGIGITFLGNQSVVQECMQLVHGFPWLALVIFYSFSGFDTVGWVIAGAIQPVKSSHQGF